MPLHEYLEQKRRQNIATLNASGACHICGSTGRDSRGFSHFIDSQGSGAEGQGGHYNENSMAPRPQLAAMRTCACFGQSTDDPDYWPYSLRVCDKCIEDDAGIGRIRNCGICGTVACDENCGAELLECSDCSSWNNAGCLECRKLGDFSEIPLFRKNGGSDGRNHNAVDGGLTYSNHDHRDEPRITRVCARCLDAGTPWVKYDFVCRRFKCETRLVPSAIVERKRHCTFGSSPLNLLPEDGLVSVVGYLMGKDLKSLFLTCSAMCTVAERVAQEKTQRASHLVPPGPITVTTRNNTQGQKVDWTRLDGSNDHNLSAPEDVKAWVGAYHYLQKITKEMYYFGFQSAENNLAVERFINSEEERFEFGQTYLKMEDILQPLQRESELTPGFVIRGGCISVREGGHEGQPALTLAANTMLETGRHAIICRLFVPGSGGARSNRDATNNKLGAVGVLRTNLTDGQRQGLGPPASWAQRVELTEGWLTEDIVFGLAYDAESRELVVHSNAHANRVSRFHSSRYTVGEGEGDLRIGLELTTKSARAPFTLLGVRNCNAEEWTSFVNHTRQTNPGGVAMDGAAARAIAAFDFMGAPLDALDAMDEDDDDEDGLDGLDLAGADAGDARRVIRQRFIRQALQRRRRAREAAAGNVGNVVRVPRAAMVLQPPGRIDQAAIDAADPLLLLAPPPQAPQAGAANDGVAERPARRVVRALRPAFARPLALPERQNNQDMDADEDEAPPVNDMAVDHVQPVGAAGVVNLDEEVAAAELVREVEMND